jgi:PRC-barrel domain
MKSKLIAAALVSTALFGSMAFAQDKSTTTTTTTAAPATAGEKMMLQGKWRASKLMGLDVYNDANEKLGDINELIVDKDGKINAEGSRHQKSAGTSGSSPLPRLTFDKTDIRARRI